MVSGSGLGQGAGGWISAGDGFFFFHVSLSARRGGLFQASAGTIPARNNFILSGCKTILLGCNFILSHHKTILSGYKMILLDRNFILSHRNFILLNRKMILLDDNFILLGAGFIATTSFPMIWLKTTGIARF